MQILQRRYLHHAACKEAGELRTRRSDDSRLRLRLRPLALVRPSIFAGERLGHIDRDVRKPPLLPRFEDWMRLCEQVADKGLLNFEDPLRHIFVVVAAALSVLVLDKVETIDEGHVEDLVGQIVEVHVDDSLALADDGGEGEGVGGRAWTVRFDLVKEPEGRGARWAPATAAWPSAA